MKTNTTRLPIIWEYAEDVHAEERLLRAFEMILGPINVNTTFDKDARSGNDGIEVRDEENKQ
jgi:hypothetical protein